jgi:hypothetical protein
VPIFVSTSLPAIPPKLLNEILPTVTAKASTAFYAPVAVFYAAFILFYNVAARLASLVMYS